ncbi:hypothetical protein PROFUN_10941 [Planoprotostelium fungivorum]|uniref:Uncharacterized protein n=1 Tax=Planoprotostelium fungivorum TaxID=1890364 RepID=A0A2P6NC21_9EUKA|nr:hypothetical protein PROFUN_10941 [Planoprotostelium fungivorum]
MDRNRLGLSEDAYSPSSSMYLSSSTTSLNDPPIHPNSTYSTSSQVNSAFSLGGSGIPSQSSWNTQDDEYDDSSLSLHRSDTPADSRVFSSVQLNGSPPAPAKPIYLPPYFQPDRSDSFIAEPPQYLQPEREPFEEESQVHTSNTRQTTTGINPLILAFATYFFGWLGGLVMIFVEKKSRFVLVHAWQSLTAGLLSMIFQVAFLWSTLLIKLYWLSYSAFICFMLVRVILDAPSQRIYKLPLIGNWCEVRAYNRIQSATAGVNPFYRL